MYAIRYFRWSIAPCLFLSPNHCLGSRTDTRLLSSTLQLMVRGYKKGLVKFALITGTKP